jgi:hypothetical protein
LAPEVRRLARRFNGATARRAAVAWALGVAAVRFFRSGELIVRVFALAVVVNLGAYMISTHAQNLLGAREMAAVLPLGAVLAGRVLGDRIPAWIRVATGWLVPVLAVLTAGYLAALGYGAAQISAELTFGRPQRIYHADGYTNMIWHTNLLTKLAPPRVS